MASNIPTRRVTRAARITVKENENANARITRTTRSKPPSASGSAAVSGPSKSIAATDAAQGKRKREALGEVTSKSVNNNKTKGVPESKGKGKDVVVKPVGKPTTATTATRVPLRSIATRSKNIVEDDGVSLDRPKKAVPVIEIPAPSNAARRAAARPTTTTSTTRKIAVHKKAPTAEEVEPEEEPLHKKRRTSSEVGDVQLEAIEEEQEIASETITGPRAHEEHAVVEEQDWDDLDREDDDDPLMVSEYVVDIFNYLKVVEQTTMPNPNYMENQKELAWKMRGILMDWLIQVHSRFKLLPETLFSCVNLIDRFLSARVVSLAKLQLVGVTCMFIAAKVEETVAPSVSNFVYCADSSYTEQEILQAEKYILKTLDWNLSYPCPLHFLRRISKADDYNVQVRTVGKYLVEVGCLEWRLLAAPPSLLAAASMWLARLILDQTDWTPNLRHFSSYPEADLIPTANLILNYVLKPVQHESFFKKYASKKYMKASVFVREWALQHWPERSMPRLEEDLPILKEESLQRLAELEALREHEGA